MTDRHLSMDCLFDRILCSSKLVYKCLQALKVQLNRHSVVAKHMVNSMGRSGMQRVNDRVLRGGQGRAFSTLLGPPTSLGSDANNNNPLTLYRM